MTLEAIFSWRIGARLGQLKSLSKALFENKVKAA
jgi:hypothetical protein